MPSKSLQFVVHEHKSSRLHYDFRLEVNGVLKSWAIPKGPSMNPADKRLAVMVPDHALEYIHFEGIIPEGSYGAGPVLVWDAGNYLPLETDDPETALKHGKLSLELKGRKLKGIFTLAQMKDLPKGTGKEWLLIKKNDSYALPYFAIRTELSPARIAKLEVKVPPCDTD